MKTRFLIRVLAFVIPVFAAVAARAQVGGVTAVSLAPAAKVYAIANPGTPNGGTGGDGYSYASTLLGSSLTWNGMAFGLGNGGSPSAVTSTSIALPTGNFATLNFLATGIYGAQVNQTFTVTYTDGTTTSVSQSLSDWGSPQNYSGESLAASTPYRVTPSGANQAGSWNLYGYTITLNSLKSVKSLTLPANSHVLVLAVDLGNVGSALPLTSVSLAATSHLYAIANNGVANGGIGNDGYSYSAALLGSSIFWNGQAFNLLGAGAPSAASATTITLPAGRYSSLSFLATAIYGNQTSQLFTVTYTDGTTSTLTQSLSDWAASQNFPGESIAATTAYRVTPSGAIQSGPWNVYGYVIPLNTTKTVQSFTLPANTSVVVLAANLTPVPAHTTICQAQGSSSYCSDQAPGAADASGYHDLNWVNLNKALSAIAVSDDQVWGIDASQVLWFLPNFRTSTAWIKVAAGVSQISAAHNLLCQLNTSQHLYCSSYPNPASSTPDANGFQAVTWFDTGATNLTQIAVSAGSMLWAIDTNANLIQIKDYTQVSSTSTMVAAGVVQVAVDGRGLVCQVNYNHGVYCSDWSAPAATANPAPYHGLPWAATGNQLHNITVADGQVWGVDSNGNVWQMPDHTTSSTWYRIAYAGVGCALSAASPPSQFVPTDFYSGEVAVLLFMGQSNAVGVNVQPTRFISPAYPNVWGVQNAGWNFLAGNTNGTAPFSGPISSINAVSWTNFALTPTSADMNLGFNDVAGPGGDAANFAAYQWQGLVNSGWKLPDLYIVHIGWPSQGVDPQDTTTASAAWTVHGVNLWQPQLTPSQTPSYALAPFARTVVYRALQNLLAAGKTPRLVGLQWNQWEAEAGNANTVSISDAPSNYKELFGDFYTAVGANFPIQIVKPLSLAYGATPLAQMQTVFANFAAANPAAVSLLDVSQISSTIFSGGVLGGGDGSVHYNLDTHEWFATQAIGACLTQGSCGTRITALPASAPN
jgi:hypothetical protein